MVRLCPVQTDRGGGDGYVRKRQRKDGLALPGQGENAGKEQVVHSDLLVRGRQEILSVLYAVA